MLLYNGTYKRFIASELLFFDDGSRDYWRRVDAASADSETIKTSWPRLVRIGGFVALPASHILSPTTLLDASIHYRTNYIVLPFFKLLLGMFESVRPSNRYDCNYLSLLHHTSSAIQNGGSHCSMDNHQENEGHWSSWCRVCKLDVPEYIPIDDVRYVLC